MTWDLREEMLLAKWRAEGHEFRRMPTVGAALCLRCETLVHVRSRARAMAGDTDNSWSRLVAPDKVKPCVPKHLRDVFPA